VFTPPHKFEFDTLIRCHHVYHGQWSDYKGKTLQTSPDPRDEARNYDEHTVGCYYEGTLVGHIPVELSQLVKQFISKEGNRVELMVTNKRQREVGLALPVKAKAFTSSKAHILALSDNLTQRKDIFPGLTLKFTPLENSNAFAIYD
jgi:hypothetical protein